VGSPQPCEVCERVACMCEPAPGLRPVGERMAMVSKARLVLLEAVAEPALRLRRLEAEQRLNPPLGATGIYQDKVIAARRELERALSALDAGTPQKEEP
jgi:hypothetical protein